MQYALALTLKILVIEKKKKKKTLLHLTHKLNHTSQ